MPGRPGSRGGGPSGGSAPPSAGGSQTGTSPTPRCPGPLIPSILGELPLRLRHQLYQALDLQLVYKHDTSQVTYHATITTSTPHTVNAIRHDAQNTTTSSDPDCGTDTKVMITDGMSLV